MRRRLNVNAETTAAHTAVSSRFLWMQTETQYFAGETSRPLNRRTSWRNLRMRDSFETKCCVVGGGPAGIMLGYLLARAGVRVTVLEKHRDFYRDFRGDTVHSSTLQLMHELGLL